MLLLLLLFVFLFCFCFVFWEPKKKNKCCVSSDHGAFCLIGVNSSMKSHKFDKHSACDFRKRFWCFLNYSATQMANVWSVEVGLGGSTPETIWEKVNPMERSKRVSPPLQKGQKFHLTPLKMSKTPFWSPLGKHVGL